MDDNDLLPNHHSTSVPNRSGIHPVIRIASFQLADSQAQTVSTGAPFEYLARICSRFDVIALQGVKQPGDAWMESLAIRINQGRPAADYFFISDFGFHPELATQSAILFNRNTVELDQQRWYMVNDPDHVLSRRPLAGWFRTRSGNLGPAFTFTLVNVEVTRPQNLLSRDARHLELAYLDDLFRAVRNDGRSEDDIILAGDFNAGDHGLQPIREQAGLTWVVSNTPTDVQGKQQKDNLVFNPAATVEFNGQAGVFDFMRRFNLTLSEAESVSKRLPVWSEFHVTEGMYRKANRGAVEPPLR